jgi:ATP-binding protein involved in chromosome partitioning
MHLRLTFPLETLLHTIRLSGVLVVTTPQDLSLMDTSRFLGMLQNHNVPILGIIENMSSLTCPHCGELVEVFHRSSREWAVESEELDLLGRIPMNISTSRAINKGHPLMQEAPDSIEAIALKGIAEESTNKLCDEDSDIL